MSLVKELTKARTYYDHYQGKVCQSNTIRAKQSWSVERQMENKEQNIPRNSGRNGKSVGLEPKKTFYPYIVEWKDHSSLSQHSYLTAPEVLNDYGPTPVIRTMGFMIYEDKEKVVLASTVDTRNAEVKHIHYILKSSITRKTKIV